MATTAMKMDDMFGWNISNIDDEDGDDRAVPTAAVATVVGNKVGDCQERCAACGDDDDWFKLHHGHVKFILPMSSRSRLWLAMVS